MKGSKGMKGPREMKGKGSMGNEEVKKKSKG